MKNKSMETSESAKSGRLKSINIDGTKYKTHYTTKFSQRTKWEKPDVKKVFSFIPGTIIKVKISAGKKVKNGQLALIFEAMKMRNRVYVPKAGIVKKVNVKEGELVPKGKLIFEME